MNRRNEMTCLFSHRCFDKDALWQVALGLLFIFVVVVGLAYVIHHIFPSLNSGLVQVCSWEAAHFLR
jgi:hypothetical protein